MTAFLQVHIASMIEVKEYSATCFTENCESTLVNCCSKCCKKYDSNVALRSNSNNNNAKVDAYSNYTYYASNIYGDDQCDFKTYIKCGEYKVSNKDGKEITQ